jgi:hypothetical protein
MTGLILPLWLYTKLILGASAALMSSFGYYWNKFAHLRPGGCKYKDFLMFGTPMQLVLGFFRSPIYFADRAVVSQLGTGLSWLLRSLFRIVGTSIMTKPIAASRKKGATTRRLQQFGVSSLE